MGFFSWSCRGCGHSIRNPYAITQATEWMNDMVVLTPDGARHEGMYDGYGRLMDEVDLVGAGLDETMDVWHRNCWIADSTPAYQGPAASAADQGHFLAPESPDPPNPITPGTP